MELISVASAKSIWLLNAIDLYPKGLRILPQLTEALLEKYDFEEPEEDTAKNATSIKLKDGLFEKDGEAYRVGLEIYDDGFVGESAASTALTEEFLASVIDWAKSTFEIKFDPSLIMRKVYYSEVVVRFQSPLATVCAAFSQFADLLEKEIAISGTNGFSLSALTFSSRLPIGNSTPAVTIERRANTSPAANIFYCKAPLTTDAFLQLLNTFDSLMAK